MKIRSKLLIALASVVLGTVGCQRTGMVSEQSGEHVKFSPYVGKAGTLTKGAPLTAFAIGDRFKVFAYDATTTDALFDNVTVTLSENGDWVYSPLKMWNNQTLNFYAYSPVDNANVTANITPTAQTFGLTVPSDVNQHVDLVIAGSRDLSRVDVPLAFGHLTSRVSFKACKHLNATDKELVRINAISIDDYNTPAQGLISEGTYTVTNITTKPIKGTWAPGTASTIYRPELTHATSIGLTTTLEAITKDNQSMFVIPQVLTNKRLVVEYEFSLDGGFSWTKYTAHIKLDGNNLIGDPILANGFEQGKHYVFNLTLNAAKTYVFTPTIEAWEDDVVPFNPTSPISIERVESVSTSAIERFVITDDSKSGYTIASQAASWVKIGSKSGLTFGDAEVKTPWVFDGTTKAVGDSGDPAQDWYIYLAPNFGAERRTSVVVTFNDPSKPRAVIQIVQEAALPAANPIKLSNNRVRIYTTAATAVSGLEIANVFSTDASLTKGVTLDIPGSMTLVSPTSPFDITESEKPLTVNLATGYTNGTVTIKAADYISPLTVQKTTNLGLSSAASNRVVVGKFVKAELVNVADAAWCNVALDGNTFNDAGTMVTSATASDIYLVVSANPDVTTRKVAVKLTDASGNVTVDYYYQDPSNLIAPTLTADAGYLYYFGNQALELNVVRFTSQTTATYNFAAGIGLYNNGRWDAVQGDVRNLAVSFINAAPTDTYISVTSATAAPLVIPVRLSTGFSASASKVFIPGQYTSATQEAPGAATISNSENDPGSETLSVTNPDGVWIHYPENIGAPRVTTILLKNDLDWKKSTRVILHQGDLTVNHNADYTDLARPVKWAGSNIYINEAGEPTFDDVNVYTHAKYQGVFFAWGGMTALQSSVGTVVATNGVVWKPTEHSGNVMVDMNAVYGSPNHRFTPHSRYNPANAQGDICRYMTENSLAPKGKKWRLPTSMELSKSAEKGLQAVNPYTTTKPNPGVGSDGTFGSPGPFDLGRRVIESGVIMSGNFFPASGIKNNASQWNEVAYTIAGYWTSCYTSNYHANGSAFAVNINTMSPSWSQGDISYNGGFFFRRTTPIRCVVDEDNSY